MRLPPEARGMSWREYESREWAAMVEEAVKLRKKVTDPEINHKAIRTKRDGYGWRGLPNGNRMLDREDK